MTALAGCGGNSIGSFDTFQPRTASTSDFASKSFGFGWLPVGNPLKNDLGAFDLQFGAFDVNGDGTFTVTEHDGGTASGTAHFASPHVTFTVTSTTGTISLTGGYTVINVVEADVNDGRIRLTNQATSAEATADPLP